MKQTLRTIIALLVTGSLAAPACAETVTLSLDQAVSMASASSPRLRSLESLRDAARAGVDQAEGARLPVIDLSAGYSRNSDVPELKTIIPDQGIVTIFPNLPDKWQTRASLELPIYTGGKVSSSIDSATALFDAAGSDTFAARNDVVLETTAAFWNLVTSLERERVVVASLASYDQHLVDARNRVELGFAARNELLAVQAERQRAELQVISARSAVEIAEANLRRLTGLTGDAHIEPVASETAGTYARDELDTLVSEALASRPELLALRARVEAAEAAVVASAADRRPQAGLVASYEYANPNPKILPLVGEWNDTWSVGVGVSWRVFDGGRTNAAEAESLAKANALREQQRDLEEKIRLEVTRHVLDLVNARAAEEVARAGLEAATENERVTRDRYREGVSPSSELLDAEALTRRAGLDVTEATNASRVARAQIERAVGR